MPLPGAYWVLQRIQVEEMVKTGFLYEVVKPGLAQVELGFSWAEFL